MGPFPTGLGGIAPEHLQIVVAAAFGVEEMDDDVNEVNQNPSGLGQPSNRKGRVVGLSSGLGHLHGQTGHLAIGSTGGNDEKVGNRREAAKVKDDNVCAVAVEGQTGQLYGNSSGSWRFLASQGCPASLCAADYTDFQKEIQKEIQKLDADFADYADKER